MKESPRCELQIGNVRLKHLEKFNYVESVITDDRIVDIEIRRHFEIPSEHKTMYQKSEEFC